MVRYNINEISAYFEKKVQEIEKKNTSKKVYENNFLEKMHNLENKRSFGFFYILQQIFIWA